MDCDEDVLLLQIEQEGGMLVIQDVKAVFIGN